MADLLITLPAWEELSRDDKDKIVAILRGANLIGPTDTIRRPEYGENATLSLPGLKSITTRQLCRLVVTTGGIGGGVSCTIMFPNNPIAQKICEAVVGLAVNEALSYCDQEFPEK